MRATMIIGQGLAILGAIAIAVIATQIRTPFFASIRSYLFWGLIGLGLVLVCWALFREVRSGKSKKWLNRLILAISVTGLTIVLGVEIQFQTSKYRVFHADSARLQRLGQHFIIGYRDLNEVKNLVQLGAVGGVFITQRNVKNKSAQEIQKELASLQKLRQENHLEPLWIATDREGGIVSRLSPPLSVLPPLSQVVDAAPNPEQLLADVEAYATIQARELSELGINLNFAPVVDLNKNIVNPDDKFSKIYQRAISEDKEVVTKVARWYCQTFARYNLRCTLKHFPGLGRVAVDTHLEKAVLSTPIEVLNKEDWLPFQELMKTTNAAVMLGHVILPELDRVRAVSFSPEVINQLLRKQWQYDGILITDDFCMYAVYGSEWGLEKATVSALNSGVDLVLIAYDPDLYYSAMNALLRADITGALNSHILVQSQRRLHREFSLQAK